VAEFYLEAVPQVQEGDELLITGETTGAYETIAHDMHDSKGTPQTVIEKGNYFAIKTDKIVRRGDRIFLLKENKD
jgi:phosphoribosylaminoimidazole (AIR) synthetase